MELLVGQSATSGGSSGGGSINIFSNNILLQGELAANGGNYDNLNNGGAGGNGSISLGNISSGSYLSEYKNY